MMNPYEGIEFVSARTQNKFAAMISSGTTRRDIVGYFDTLQEAIDARRAALNQEDHE